MKVCVFGLWHLGTVTAACLAAVGHEVTGLDLDEAVVEALSTGRPPVFEPGLAELVQAGLASGRLEFTADAGAATGEAEVLWVAFDTPVGDNDQADAEYVIERATRVLSNLRDGALVLVSSQLPVGSTRRLEAAHAALPRPRRASFACVPENLRLGKAIDAFTRPDRVVVGLRSAADRVRVSKLLEPFTDRFEWMAVESAEMTKHALNAFLATSVTFINEIAALCEHVGADATEVARGLLSEARIGPRAYLSPGAAFAGGTLARDVVFLSELGHRFGVPMHLVPSVKSSNDAHGHWAERRLGQLLGSLSARTVGVWGLTYKPGTDTLRRSSAVELCLWLLAQGALVRAHDPVVKVLPPDLAASVALADNELSAVEGADALVVATPWPEYRAVRPDAVLARMARPLVLDAGRHLRESLGQDARIEYVSVGKAGG